MADLFSDEWMKSYMEQWNAEPELSDKLASIQFNTVIGYGFDGEDAPGRVGSGKWQSNRRRGLYRSEPELGFAGHAG